jgi:hypothetical protein
MMLYEKVTEGTHFFSAPLPIGLLNAGRNTIQFATARTSSSFESRTVDILQGSFIEYKIADAVHHNKTTIRKAGREDSVSLTDLDTLTMNFPMSQPNLAELGGILGVYVAGHPVSGNGPDAVLHVEINGALIFDERITQGFTFFFTDPSPSDYSMKGIIA